MPPRVGLCRDRQLQGWSGGFVALCRSAAKLPARGRRDRHAVGSAEVQVMLGQQSWSFPGLLETRYYATELQVHELMFHRCLMCVMRAFHTQPGRHAATGATQALPGPRW